MRKATDVEDGRKRGREGDRMRRNNEERRIEIDYIVIINALIYCFSSLLPYTAAD